MVLWLLLGRLDDGRRRRAGPRPRGRRGRIGARVAAKGPGGGELAELVSDHVLGEVDRDEFLPVVHRDGVPDHLRHDRGAPRPGLEDLLLVAPVHLLDATPQHRIHESALLDASRHGSPYLRRRTMYLSVRLLLRVFFSRTPQGVQGCRPPEVFPSPPPSAGSTGFMATP